MVTLYAILGLILAVFAELSLSAANFGWTPPLVFFGLVLAFWRVGFWHRIWIAIALGIFFDIVYPFSFGSHTVIFLFMGITAAALRAFFSNADSLLTGWVASSCLLFLSLSLLHPISFALNHIKGGDIAWNGAAEIAGIVYAAQALFLPLLWFGSLYVIKKNARRRKKITRLT